MPLWRIPNFPDDQKMRVVDLLASWNLDQNNSYSFNLTTKLSSIYKYEQAILNSILASPFNA